MPAGTTVSAANNNVTYTPNGATKASPATVSITAGTPVMNTNYDGGTIFALTVTADCSAGTPVAYPAGTLNIVVTMVPPFPLVRTVTNIPVTVN
jgi:hypothetical protein